MSNDEGNKLTIEASEFQRLQTQLIELRTTNYQLKEDQQKLESEIGQLKDAVQTKARDLDKANKALLKSKKAKELSTLLEENNSLQHKLVSQEEDFNLQNRTLMEEINRMCEENETLKAQVKSGGGGGGERGGEGGGRGEESEGYTRLKAENTALQKSLQVLRDKLSSELTDTEKNESGETVQQSSHCTPRELELQLCLDTEREEKALLVRKLEEVQEAAKEEKALLQSQLDTWVDKAKKKQDSFIQLQQEKEKLFVESRATYDEMVRTKEHEIQSLQEQVQKLGKDLMTKDEMSSVGAEIAKQLETLSTEKEELSVKCATLIKEKEGLSSERDGLKSVAEELGDELQQTKAELGEQKTAVEYLNTQLEEARMSQEQLADQVARASEERQTIEQRLQQAEKLAEKRKTLVDEMSIKGHEVAEEQRKKMEEVQDKLREEVEKLEKELDEERMEVHRLSTANDELPELHKRMKSLEEKQQTHDTTVSQMEATLSEERERNEMELQRITAEHKAEKESLEDELSRLHADVEAGKERVKELEMMVGDKEEQVRIVEKKSNGLLKDLKRQLHHMQKKEEKLQEQLSDMAALDHLPPHFTQEQSSDNLSKHSRDSSLSSIKGHMVQEGSVSLSASSPSSSLATTPATTSTALGLQFGSSVSEETRELLGRVTDLQREKWELEERVNHLETTGSALAEDVMHKSEIIKSYFMLNKADHTPQRRTVADKMSPMRLLTSKNKEDTLNEINRKMQRALEETLTKNIHLQENVMMLTAELEKLSEGRKTETTSPAAAESSQDVMQSPSLDQTDSSHMTVT